MAGKFMRTVTVTAVDTPTQLSSVMRVEDSTCEIHVAEWNGVGLAGGTVYMGDASMVSPGAGLPPVNFLWMFDGDSNPYNSGGGRDHNFIHLTDYWLLGLAINQKLHIETIVR